MKIIISTDSIKYPITGIARYASELISHFSDMPEIESLKYMSGLKVVDSKPEIPNAPMSSSKSIKKFLSNSKLVSDVYRLVVPALKGKALLSYQDYIYHSPNYYLPPGHKKSCATFHDLSVFKYPGYHPRGRVHLMHKELISAAKRATVLITDSHYTKNEISEFFDFPPSKIVVTPLASSGDFFPRKEVDCLSVMERYGLKFGNFTFFAGTIEPRKNIKNLLLAYQNLPKALSTAFPLVISGYKGWESEDIHRLFEDGSKQGWLKYLGYVDQHSLSVLYSSCRGFLFPSRYEGFGLPVLEAMAAGTPVITSNVTSLPEVAGDAALLVDPDDIDLLASHIQSLLLDDLLCHQLVQKGFVQNAKFSWRKCAIETINAYKLVEELQ